MAQDLFLTTPPTATSGIHSKYTIGYLDAIKLGTAAAGSNYIVLENLPQGSIITFTRQKFTTAFAGTTLLDTTVGVGTATYSAGVPTVSNFSAVGGALRVSGTVSATEGTTAGGINTNITGLASAFGTTSVICVLFQPTTGAAITALTAGSLDVWFDYIVLGS